MKTLAATKEEEQKRRRRLEEEMAATKGGNDGDQEETSVTRFGFTNCSNRPTRTIHTVPLKDRFIIDSDSFLLEIKSNRTIHIYNYGYRLLITKLTRYPINK